MNAEKTKLRIGVLHSLEEGNDATAEFADYVATEMLSAFSIPWSALGMRYDC